MRGHFITFEGGEGSGKSTHAKALAERLTALGIEVVLTREPGGSPGAEIIRHVILSGIAKPLGAETEAFLFAAARDDHVQNTILPALAAGRWVICDRFIDSTRVYQGVLGNVDGKLIRGLERITVGKDARPDVTFLLDVPATVGLARAQKRREHIGQRVARDGPERTGPGELLQRRDPLAQVRVRADQLTHGHPEAAGLLALGEERLEIHLPAQPSTRREHRQRAHRRLQIAHHLEAVAIAGVLARAAVRSPEPRERLRRKQERVPLEVPRGEVSQFVPDHEVELPGVRAVVHQRRVDDHELAREQLGGKRVERPAGLQEVDLRELRHVEPLRRGLAARVRCDGRESATSAPPAHTAPARSRSTMQWRRWRAGKRAATACPSSRCPRPS